MENNEKSELTIYGKKPVIEALRSEHPVKKIFIAREMDKKDSYKIRNIAEKKRVRIIDIKKSELQRICGPVLHQGVAAVLNEFEYLNEKELIDIISKEKNTLLLILDQVQDPHNLGAILRTSESAGVTALVLPEKGSASVTPTVAKTSAGAVFHSLIHQTLNLPDFLKKLKENNISLIAMVPHQTEMIYDADLSGSIALVVGSEGKGVRKNIQRICDKSISIPRLGKIDSLNASVSTAVVVFEAVRQRLKVDGGV